ncbi:Folate transporter 1 [Merluccius polli]|uniref:Folate transporter 1 n=1 Tax=Merluccius polli TaxID=89951 RepID=A0AA47NTH2_MERPO|nr:Folate transporter 1 [Merluccius polli]
MLVTPLVRGVVRGVVRVPNLRLWCLWWVFNSTGYYLVLFYTPVLWNKVYPATENKHMYNGAVEAVSTLLGAMTSFLTGFVKIRWNLWSELVIGVITAL